MGDEIEQRPMQPAFRYGAYDTSIDSKHRILVPAEARNGLDPERDGKGFFVNLGTNRKLWFHPERSYTQLVSERTHVDITPSAAALEYNQLIFANTYQREPDKQGRLVLPERLVTRAGLVQPPELAEVPIEVTFIGVRDHFEVWRREEWDTYSDSLDQRSSSIVQTAEKLGLK
jgi:MraZ protein